MSKVVTLETVIKPWGKTANDVYQQANAIVTTMNTPDPFETAPNPANMSVAHLYMTEACIKASKDRRKGMMVSSQFKVERIDDTVLVWHVRNTNEPRIFLKIVKVL